MSATARLVEALRQAGAGEAMCQAAGRGYYDDFRSPLATPKMQLVKDLRALKTPAGLALANRVIDGDFDD